MIIMTSPPKITKKNSLPMWIDMLFMVMDLISLHENENAYYKGSMEMI